MPPPLKRLIIALGILLLCFSWPLYELVRFSIGSSLFSHIPLIPFISLYLIWLKRGSLKIEPGSKNTLSTLFAVGATALMLLYGVLLSLGSPMAVEDSLSLTTASLVLFVWSICCYSFGKETIRMMVFPLGLLLFTIPLPTFAIELTEYFLQHGSAIVALELFKVSGTPVFNEDLVFQLPGMSLRVAPECSGIHSTLALFITSLLAGYLFLRSTVNRTLLALTVIPLALLRNGFRIFVIGELCVHINPDMIHSYIHRQGGPIFFVLSLIPFSLLLMLLIRIEKGRIGKSESRSI